MIDVFMEIIGIVVPELIINESMAGVDSGV